MSVLWICGKRAYFFRGHKQEKRCCGAPGDVGRQSQTSEHWQLLLCTCFPENFRPSVKIDRSLQLGEWLLPWIPIGLNCLTSYLFVRTALLLPHPHGSAGPAHLGTPDYPGVSTWLNWTNESLPGVSWLWTRENIWSLSFLSSWRWQMESLEAVGHSIVPSMEKTGHQQEGYTCRERTRVCMALQCLILVLPRFRHMLLP